MKTVEFVVIFAISINFAYTSSINLGYNEVEGPAETGDTAPVPSDEEIFVIDTPDLGTRVEMWEARRCLPGECNAHCRKLGYARGVCIGNLCQCRLRTSPVMELEEEAEFQNAVETGINPLVQSDKDDLDAEKQIEPRASRCTASACAQICRRLGFRYSRCSGSRCICWR